MQSSPKHQRIFEIAYIQSWDSTQRIIEWYELDRIIKDYLVQFHCNEQGHPQLDQVAQGLVQPHLEGLQASTHHVQIDSPQGMDREWCLAL